MIYYTIKRILMLIPVILIVTFLVFILLNMAPGTIIDTMNIEKLTTEQYEELLSRYNLDKPVVHRYFIYMERLILHGDFGKSDFTDTNIWSLYITRWPTTLLLALCSVVFGASIGIPLGIFAANRSGTLWDNAVTLFTLIGISIPGFWLALMLMLQFSLKWPILPASGLNDGIKSLVMPTICGGIGLMASGCRQTRSSMLEQLNADYLRTARAKGVAEKKVIRSHALGNAMIPILTTLGNSLAFSISGSNVIETVFSIRGVGQLSVEAIQNRDVTLTMGCVILSTVMFTTIQLLVDILYAFVDPRVKSRYARPKKIKEGATT